MLVGNDFLPQMPHLDIIDGSLDLCLMIYRELAPTWGGFLTDEDKIHLPRFELFVRVLAAYEFKFFERRGTIEKIPQFQDPQQYRSFYYQSKFGNSDEQFIRQLAQEYILGLFWCLAYYQLGVSSWDWYYPYHYAPLASDLVDLVHLKYEFPTAHSRPYTPLMQLLSVLPQQSAPLLPKPYAQLMTAPGLKHYFPLTFETDQNGKHQPWESVVLIPFIDEDVLISHLSQIDHLTELTEQELKRNDVRDATEWISPANFQSENEEQHQDNNLPPSSRQRRQSSSTISMKKTKENPDASLSSLSSRNKNTATAKKKKKAVTMTNKDASSSAPRESSP
mmetsp:Transcript_22955/g.29739  ORF Transcript_22955/g.29739 Transcript_22955/m.29739 type:complete len:335 (-) Transcript_22955:119-1123(-)